MEFEDLSEYLYHVSTGPQADQGEIVDPILSLAFCMSSNPGAYACLLGSGLSQAASIRTGWEVTQDLIRRVALLRNEECIPDPDTWYRQVFDQEPGYVSVVAALAHTPTERRNLLKPFFEPATGATREAPEQSTRAHLAIARLAKKGYIRLILTTNLDRLCEAALREVGVTPVVISNADQLKGAVPLVHSACTVVKLNGDYLDIRTKNTVDELQKYDRSISKLLDRVFDEYGLLVCGWSATWDEALIGALERCKSRRYSTYWTARGGRLGESAAKIVGAKSAQVISITDADQFFEDLESKVLAIEDLHRANPVEGEVALAQLKEFLVDPSKRIRLRDLLARQTDELTQRLAAEDFSFVQPASRRPEVLAHRISRLESLTEGMVGLVSCGAYYGEEEHNEIWVQAIERIAQPKFKREDGVAVVSALMYYPGFLLMWAASLGAYLAERYGFLDQLLARTSVRVQGGEKGPLIFALARDNILSTETWRSLPGISETEMAGDHIRDVLLLSVKCPLPDEEKFRDLFDDFEYLLALIYVDTCRVALGHAYCTPPIGPYFMRREFVEARIQPAVLAGEHWLGLQQGLFGQDPARLQKAIDVVRRGGWSSRG